LRQSLSIIEQTLNKLPSGVVKNQEMKFVFPMRDNMKKSMESLIAHFKLFSEGLVNMPSLTYVGIEAPKGELGIYLINKDVVLNEVNQNMPIRCQIRSPGFFHLQNITKLVKNSLVADLVTVIGSQDLVLGEIDR
jgi:NADH:ubiquinone oxidoreductase subunit D